MAARAANDRPPPSTAPYIPPQISTQDPLLAARISLPPNTIISYAILKPTMSASVHTLEQARRSLLSSSPIQESTLTSVQVGYDPCIYIFKLAQLPASPGILGHLNFDGLVVQELSSFSPPSISSPFPDPDKRILIAHFYDAVRSRLIDDLVNAASQKPSPIQRHVKRFKNGFLMSQISAHSGWEPKAITRPLVFCHLQIHFSYTSGGNPSHLVVHPILQPTPFLDISHSLPLPNGTPITLLPFGIPAYFLACYTGPTAGLIKQFHAALQGLGSGTWDTPPMSPFSTHTSTFLIGWIKVENKQGEDKGLTIIYPTRLCLAYLPSSSSRATLDYVPELPIPLQPSPPATDTSLSLTRPGRLTPHARRLSVITSPTPESLYSFRALTLVPRDLEQVTAEVGGYIDAVARERERERERLKRERESGTTTTPKSVRTSSTTPATATVVPVEQSTSTSSTLSSGPPPSGPLSFPSSSQALPPTPLSIPPSTSMQNFYPSPPQSDPTLLSSAAKTSPTISNNPTPDPTSVAVPPTQGGVPEPAPPPSTTSVSSSFDLYNVDSTWTRSADNYLGMAMDNMDFAMDDLSLNFNLDIESLPNTSSAGGTMTSFKGRDAVTTNMTGMEFEDAFTDDDFSFFDQPSKPSAPTPTLQHSLIASGTRALTSNSLSDMSPPNFDLPPRHLHPIHVNPQHSSTAQLWTSVGLMDGFTPRSLTEQIDSVPPELLPSSPGHTTDSQSVPVTPNIYLEFDHSIKRPATATGGSFSGSLFQPIPFAQYHRQSDGKYAVGKFALPSPPPDVTSVSLPASPSGFNLGKGWRNDYDSVTNPRISLVNKLKRKAPPIAIGPPSKRVLRSKTPEEWEMVCHDDALNCEMDESDMDSTEDDEEPEDNDNMTQSRPTTPPPSYLPHGPDLLATHFQHQHLLPLSVALRPPGASIDPLNLASNINNPPPSVPTPVSPAATLGAASEKSRSLEAAAYTVASQVVENPIWAETWKANVVGARNSGSVWSTDVKAVKILMEQIPELEAPVTIEALFGLADAETMDLTVTPGENESKSKNVLQPMEAPMLSIGKGEAIIQVLPPALRFWEKLGLTPKGGQKDVVTYILFEDDGHKASFMQNWLSAIKNAYQGKHYGLMTYGTSTTCSTDGLVPLRFDASFRKTLTNLVSTLTSQGPPIILFLVLPISIMTLSSPVLRQIFAASKKIQASGLAQHLLFEFIPEPHIYTALQKPSAYDSAIDILSSSLYNRILIPVDRIRSRRITNFDDGKDDIRSYLMAPSFTLARPIYNKVSFVRAPNTSLDIMDRYMLLHVGYHVTGKWIIASCVDQRGECYDLGVWLTQSDGESDISNEEFAVRKVWDFAMQFAKRVNVEWRIVFARLGVLTVEEVEAWDTHLNVKVVSCREQPPLHHTLVCVVPDAEWLFVPLKTSPYAPIRSSPNAKQQLVFTDVSSTTYAIFPSSRIPIAVQPVHSDLGLSQSFIAEPPISHSSVASPRVPSQPNTTLDAMQRTAPLLGPSADSPSEMYHLPTFLLPHSTSILIRVPHPNSTCPTSTSMTHIHLFRTYNSASSSQSRQTQLGSAVPDEKQLLSDVTRNYYELSVLSNVRWKLDGMGGHHGLPFHLSATDAMRMALDKDWDRFERHIEP